MTPEEYAEYYRNLYAPKTPPKASPVPVPGPVPVPTPTPTPGNSSGSSSGPSSFSYPAPPTPCPAPPPFPMTEFESFISSLKEAVNTSCSTYDDDVYNMRLAAYQCSSNPPILSAFKSWLYDQTGALTYDDDYQDVIDSIDDWSDRIHDIY